MNEILRVARLTPRVREWLAASGPVRFLHIFENACNLINPVRSVLSIVHPDIGAGPFNAVLSQPFRFGDWFAPDTPAMLEDGILHLGQYELSIERAADWNPRPEWPLMIPIEMLRLFEDISDAHKIRPGIRVEGLPEMDEQEEWIALAVFLAGRGPGLTPTGDDFLMGLFHSLQIRLGAAAAGTLCGRMAEAAAPRTTTLSGEWLRAAAAGEAGEPWHRLVGAIRDGQSDRITAAVQGILATGHTSGADALAGFIKGLK